MSTPLYDALHALSTKNSARFHMPGHKGVPSAAGFPFPIDYTETYGTGNLYEDEGPITDAEHAAAAYYHAADCLFLTGGSTQGVLSMLTTACGIGGEVLLDRNCHRSVCHALALLDLKPHFIMTQPEPVNGFCRPMTAGQVEHALQQHPNCRALLLTSPNYYGVRQPLSEIAAVCRAHGIPLLVDCAHGAHFPAIGLPTPLEEGASACVMSAHKTLPAMGQAALLLTDGSLDHGELRESSRLFGTTSPSYPILASIDCAREWLEHTDWTKTVQACEQAREHILAATPFLPLCTAADPPLDPTRLTICTAGTERSGHALADLLYKEYNIAVEMADSRNIVCIVTPFDLTENLAHLLRALDEIALTTAGTPLPPDVPPQPAPQPVLTVREAWFRPRVAVPLEQAVGRVCARPVTPYPPGVPIVFPGEEITAKHVVFLKNVCYNEDCEVVKE